MNDGGGGCNTLTMLQNDWPLFTASQPKMSTASDEWRLCGMPDL
jgi:hypothetical protein